jgi:bifunctional DNase/RNase
MPAIKRKLPSLLVWFVLLAAIAYAVGQFIDMEKFVKADVVRVDGNTIILGVGCRAIVADTTEERAESIALGLAGKIDERPNTHDTFVDALKTFNITVDSVSLVRYDGKFYYSDLVLKGPNKVLKLDTRPSDAIAIAVRAAAPMYINKTLLAEQGKNIC